jgi:hypothetical protein
MNLLRELLSKVSPESMTRFCLLFSVVVPISLVFGTWCAVSLSPPAKLEDIPASVITLVTTILAGGWVGKIMQGNQENAAKKEECKDAGAPVK